MAFGILLLIILILNLPTVTADGSEKKILLLNSYNPGLSWTDDITSAIQHRLSITMPSAKLSVEYMDTKKHPPDEERLAYLRSIYLQKYKDQDFDLIMSSDDDAFSFLLQNRDDLFPGSPVVFCGVNYFDDSMLEGKAGFTGLVEGFDLNDTLNLMLRLHPRARHLVVINDETTTGRANRKILDNVVPVFSQRVSFEFLDNITAEDMQRRVSNLTDDSLILLLIFNMDRNGRVFTYEESAEMIRSASTVPAYGLWDMLLGYGIVGGKLTSGWEQGTKAAEIALRILQGESIENLPLIKVNPNRYMFDMLELRRFKIPLSSLPPQSIIMNQPLQDRADLGNLNLSGMNLSWSRLNQVNLNNTSLCRTDLSHSSLIGSWITNSDLSGADLSEADLRTAWMYRSKFVEADMSNAKLDGASLNDSDLSGSRLAGADLTKAYLDSANLTGADLAGARLFGADLSYAEMNETNMIGANFIAASINWASLGQSILSRCQFSRSELFMTNLSHCDLSNSDFTRSYMMRANLVGADLTDAKLEYADLTEANLSHANLRGMTIQKVSMDRADLNGADLTGAAIDSLVLEGTVMRNAVLKSARITGVKFKNMDLSGADLRDATLDLVVMQNVDLSGADLRGANLTLVGLIEVNLKDANLLEIKYDRMALQFLAASKLDGAKMSTDLRKDLDGLQPGLSAG